jgi:DNA-binding transcriptional LysR family regulator
MRSDQTLGLDLTDRLVDIVGEGYDLAIRTGEVSDSRLMTRRIGRFRHAIVAAPAYLMTQGLPQTAQDLLQYYCLHRRDPRTGAVDTWPLASGGNKVEIDLPVSAIVSSLEARIDLAEQGAGIACIPRIPVAPQLENGRLVPLMEEWIDDAGVFRLLRPAGSGPSFDVRALVDFLVQSSASQEF